MAAVNIRAFRGEVPRVSQRLLQPNYAFRAMNCKLGSGRVDPLGGTSTVYSPTQGTIVSKYRYRFKSTAGDLDYWLTFTDDTDVQLSPLANDPQGKFYYSSDAHEPRMSTHAAAISGPGPYPAAFYALGLPLPTVPITVTPSGGSGTTITRSYAFTFVTALGEESGPSPASATTTGKNDDTWALSNIQTAPLNSGTISAVANNTPSSGYVRLTVNSAWSMEKYDSVVIAGVVGMTDLNGTHRLTDVDKTNNYIFVQVNTAQTYTSGGTWARSAPLNTTGMTKRIYRTEGTEATFLYVAEIPVATTTYNDTIAGSALGEPLPTLNSLPPPKNLHPIISLPNGCLAGLAGNELCLSDPYMPYSWPQGNRYSFSGSGVALAPAGTNVVVLTDGQPIIFSGTDPEVMSPSVMQTMAPCVAKRGAVDVGGGMVYPSFDGLWIATPGRVEKLTAKLYREEEWSLLAPTTFVAAYQDNAYYAQYEPTSGVPQVLVYNTTDNDSVTFVEDTFSSLYANPYDGKLYVAAGNRVMLWDGDPASPYTSEWRSAIIQTPKPINFSIAQVHADFQELLPPDASQQEVNDALMIAGADAVGGHLNGDSLLELEINGSRLLPVMPPVTKKVQFTLYRDEQPVYTRSVTSSTPFRLPSGFMCEVHQVGISTSIPVYSVTIAQTVAELAQTSL